VVTYLEFFAHSFHHCSTVRKSTTETCLLCRKTSITCLEGIFTPNRNWYGIIDPQLPPNTHDNNGCINWSPLMYYMLTCPLLFAHQYQMGYADRVLNLYIIHSDSHDLQSMSATYIEPNKNCCEIIGPRNPTYIYIYIYIINSAWNYW